jgi:hypothetical protein
MGGGKSSESNQQLENAQVSDANQLTSLATQQAGNSNTLFNLGLPGLQQSEDFYGALGSGSPNAIATAIAPATQQIQQATAGAKQNILNTAPAGGEKNLAIEQADVNQGAQVGSLASQGFTSAFPALAQLGGQNVNAGISSAGTAISAGGQANSALSGVVGENIQQKGATLGAFGGLAGDATTLGAAGIGASGAAKGASGIGSALGAVFA